MTFIHCQKKSLYIAILRFENVTTESYKNFLEMVLYSTLPNNVAKWLQETYFKCVMICLTIPVTAMIIKYNDNFDVLPTLYLSIISVINLMHKLFLIISLFYASTCFEHYVLIISGSKLYYTPYGNVTHCNWSSGVQVERGVSPLSTCARGIHLLVWRYQMLYNTILTSWWWTQQCSKHVEAYNKLIIKQEFVH